MQHKTEMGNTVAVIHLDCIGSDNLYVTETSPGPQFDLDQLVLKAGQDIGVPGQTETPGGSDQETFRDPCSNQQPVFVLLEPERRHLGRVASPVQCHDHLLPTDSD